MPCKIVGGTKVPGNEKSWEQKFLGTKGPSNESSLELSFPGNESSRKRKVTGTKVPHRDYSFLGTKGLGYEKSRYPPKQKKKGFFWDTTLSQNGHAYPHLFVRFRFQLP